MRVSRRFPSRRVEFLRAQKKRGGSMTDAVYCLTESETKANAILTSLRSIGLSSEISVLLEPNVDTRNISVKEDAVRGAKIGGIIGVLAAVTLPGVGVVL